MAEPLVLELGAGFRDDEVRVLLDGREVWAGTGVSTDWSIGVAAVVPLPVPGGTGGRVEVRVGHRARGTTQLAGAPGTADQRLRCDLDPDGGMTLGPAPEGPWM
ncbi:hypothetical protein [Blastococcus sp. TF02A-30]|uniref:hypothetical protein n=1 Tax=Blastococcus sp. TF02A-30 TaxID=2250580 RepID=UPI0011BFA339|nr:hypothetical protein [Blastococcus sp. TF02A-30]